jgi:hypothetical protein
VADTIAVVERGAAAPVPGGSPVARAADLLLALPVVLFVALGLRPISDPDAWWHLRAGEYVLRSFDLNGPDPWSFASSRPWVLHEWLSQAGAAAVYEVAGYPGLVALHAAVLGALATAVVVVCRREADTVPALIAALFALAVLVPYTGERPQLTSFLLMTVFAAALRSALQRRRAPLWFIPLFWLWANLHGLWSAALVLFAVATVGLLIEVGLRRWRELRQLVLVGLACGLVVLATPIGPRLVLQPFEVRGYAQFVAEWRTPGLSTPWALCALVLLAIIVVGWLTARRMPASELAFVGAAVALGFLYVRTLPIAAVALAPMAAAALQCHRGTPAGSFALGRSGRRAIVGLAVVVAALVAVLAPTVPHYSEDAPIAASRALDSLPGRAKVINEYSWGGWLLWTAPDTSPAIDGRTEIYSVAYLRRYLAALGMRPGWQDTVGGLDADAAWLSTDTPLVSGLRDVLHWTQIYSDGRSVILVPTGNLR